MTARFPPNRTTTPQPGRLRPIVPSLYLCPSHHRQNRERLHPTRMWEMWQVQWEPPICESCSRPNKMRTSFHCGDSTRQSSRCHFHGQKVSRAASPCLDARCTRYHLHGASAKGEKTPYREEKSPSLPLTTKFSSTPPKQLRITCLCCFCPVNLRAVWPVPISHSAISYIIVHVF